MTQEEKQLLLKDLSARLTYGVICQVDDGAAGLNDGKLIEIDTSKELARFDANYYWDAYIDDIKPYLRPMSSMTEEEKKEAKENGCIIYHDTSPKNRGLMVIASPKGIDWLNAHHFDYHGLIEKGLALEAPKDMYDSSNRVD